MEMKSGCSIQLILSFLFMIAGASTASGQVNSTYLDCSTFYRVGLDTLTNEDVQRLSVYGCLRYVPIQLLRMAEAIEIDGDEVADLDLCQYSNFRILSISGEIAKPLSCTDNLRYLRFDLAQSTKWIEEVDLSSLRAMEVGSIDFYQADSLAGYISQLPRILNLSLSGGFHYSSITQVLEIDSLVSLKLHGNLVGNSIPDNFKSENLTTLHITLSWELVSSIDWHERFPNLKSLVIETYSSNIDLSIAESFDGIPNVHLNLRGDLVCELVSQRSSLEAEVEELNRQIDGNVTLSQLQR